MVDSAWFVWEDLGLSIMYAIYLLFNCYILFMCMIMLSDNKTLEL